MLTYKVDDSGRKTQFTQGLGGGTRDLLPVLVLVAQCLLLTCVLGAGVHAWVVPRAAVAGGGNLGWATIPASACLGGQLF